MLFRLAPASQMPGTNFMTKTKTPNVTSPILRVNENVSFEEQIAQRAHELWQQRSGEHGHDMTDWLQAEREINAWHHNRFKSEMPRESRNISS